MVLKKIPIKQQKAHNLRHVSGSENFLTIIRGIVHYIQKVSKIVSRNNVFYPHHPCKEIFVLIIKLRVSATLTINKI